MYVYHVMTELLEQLFILVDNYTVYKMSAIITAVRDISKGYYRRNVYVQTNKPGTIEYSQEHPGISEYIKDFIDAFKEPESRSTYQLFDPTDQQVALLNTFFTTGSCSFHRGGVGMSVHLIWTWTIKTVDLNLRTKAGRAERDARAKTMIEEATALLKKIQDLMTPEFIATVIEQEKAQRLEYDVLIPTGKKHAREIASEECDRLLRRFDKGSCYRSGPMMRIWKTPSGVLHVEPVESIKPLENLNQSDSLQEDGVSS